MTYPPTRPGPRTLVLGDSWVHGLSKGKGTLSRLIPDDLAATEKLDLSKISRIVPEVVVDHLEAIDDFAPEFALLAIGGADSLVFPAAWIQRLIDRYAPPDWQGIEGMMPRAMYARDKRKRLRQRITVGAKTLIKQALVYGLGGRRRISLEEYETATRVVLGLLALHGTTVVLLGISDVDGWMSPKSGKEIRRANALTKRLADEFPLTVFVESTPMVDKWDDYLPDHVHLTLAGHRKVADGVLAAMAAAGGNFAAVLPDTQTAGVLAS